MRTRHASLLQSRVKQVTSALLLVALLATACSVPESNDRPQPVCTAVEQGERQTAAGDAIAYDLVTPQIDASIASPPYPAVVLSHGFARDRRYHRDTACRLAERGIVVLTPNLVSLLTGESAQLRNIANLADHVRWLRTRTVDPADALFNMIDPARIALVGHSAGGAISIEAAIDLAESGEPVAAVALLDAVPWPRTIDRAADLPPVAFLSLRSDPSDCNRQGQIVEALAGLTFAADDIRIIGGTHCDAENPTDFLCSFACNGTSAMVRAIYQELLHAFLREALAALDLGQTQNLDALIQQRVEEDRIIRSAPGV